MLIKKALGQHWLKNRQILDQICAIADIKSDDQVFEIGPGQGDLTSRILAHGGQVRALEYDDEAVNFLTKQLQKHIKQNLIIEAGDIRKFDWRQLPKSYKLVANIPYYLSGFILQQLCQIENRPQIAVLLVQKEVAQRLAAVPGQHSVLSLAIQLNYSVELGPVVLAKEFQPPPKVDSQVVILRSLINSLETPQLMSLIKHGFANKRKTLVNNLQNYQGINKDNVEQMITGLGLNKSIRAQAMSLDHWQKLNKNISNSSPSLA